jgi:hypothetical protein
MIEKVNNEKVGNSITEQESVIEIKNVFKSFGDNQGF